MVEFSLPFGKKEREESFIREVPVEEVRRLRSQGKSDRDIIIELKNKGYTFQEIEKAMLQVLKESSISKEKPSEEKQQDFGREINLPTLEKISPKEQSGNIRFGSMRIPSLSPGPTQEFSTLDLLEEVVEGVVEEKIQDFSTKFDEFLGKIKEEDIKMSELKKIIEKNYSELNSKIANMEKNLAELSDQVSNLEIKVKVLEKALKEFLPDIMEKARRLFREGKEEATI